MELISIANNQALITIRYANNTLPEAQPAETKESGNLLTGMTTAIQNMGTAGKSAIGITLLAGIIVACAIFFRKKRKNQKQ